MYKRQKQHSALTTGNIYGQANVNVTKAQRDELEGIKPPAVSPPVKPQPTVPGDGTPTWGIS